MPTTLALPKPPIAPARKSWTVAQFHWLWEQGLFDGRKAFLLAGEIIEMPIPGPVHNKGVGKVDYALKRIFGSSYWVRIQLPLVLGLWTDPVPDIAVVLGAQTITIGIPVRRCWSSKFPTPRCPLIRAIKPSFTLPLTSPTIGYWI